MPRDQNQVVVIDKSLKIVLKPKRSRRKALKAKRRAAKARSAWLDDWCPSR